MTDYKAMYEQSQEENEKLKEENYHLTLFQGEVDSMEASLGEIDEEYEDYRFYELPDLIKELKEENKKHEQDNRILRLSTIGMTEEIDKLKEKNNKWTYWASDVIYWCNTHNKDILQSKKLIDGENKPTIDNVRDFGKEITELKEKMDCVCIELYACWNCSCDLLTEDIGDICGYDEDKHKKLYEKKYPRGGNIGGEH